jgi:anthraniloyl-CoA monooxygenase
MKIVSVGGGPAGLYFSILMKKADPSHEVLVLERNKADDTFGFGVVFSDQTLENLAAVDPESRDEITRSFAHWDDIEIHWKGETIRSTGHGFSGLSRQRLLDILQRRASALGVEIRYQTEVKDPEAHLGADLVLGADGVNSTVRQRFADAFQPSIDWRPNRFVWLGTTMPFEAFTFYFKEDAHGLWRVHAYRYEPGRSTFILETTEKTWRSAGLDEASEDETVAFAEELFREELRGHPVLKNRSLWRSFPNVRCGRWRHRNVVLLGDACHTAHFSIGSGTKLALEDAVALRDAVLEERRVEDALALYESRRKPAVESTQRAAQTSLEWFEETERYRDMAPLPFAMSLLTRSLRVTHEGLRKRDPVLVKKVDVAFARQAGVASEPAPPPIFTPFKVRDLVLANRIVLSPMCQYMAKGGLPDEWHLVHLGSRALGGPGLVLTEMTDVSPEGRISPGCTGIWSREHADAWKRITDFVHARARAPVGIQLGHAGRKGSTRLAWEGMDEPLDSGNWEVLAPSPIPWTERNQVPRAMTRADMDRVRDEFVRAARLSEEAGFDWIELHAAHGYLLSTFISPLTNLRTDGYGGARLADRLRFPLEVLRAIRSVWTKPISVRISASDWAPGGTTPEDAVDIARALGEAGADMIDVSTGSVVPFAEPVYGRLWQTPLSDRIRHEARIPTMTVGGISTAADANSILVAERADLCVLARAQLYDPYWTRHAATELGHDLEWPPPYSALAGYVPKPSK